jgi:chromosome segregation protein
MTALEEYQENEERSNFLIDQKNDLETSISDTKKAIKDLNKRSREQFKKAFIAVNQNFKKVFQALFGGGDCGMRLLDEEDLLESGLEIFAQPPGKRLQNVMLLSGGEKALTVLALLVGLFEYRPSQFCVLDEVDAPLDDANVHRFTKLLRKMSTKTQIIVVTHNKQTMEVADSLFGVTMEEPGISEIVSLKI